MNFNFPIQLIIGVISAVILLPIILISIFGGYVLIRYGRSIKITLSVVALFCLVAIILLSGMVSFLIKLP